MLALKPLILKSPRFGAGVESAVFSFFGFWSWARVVRFSRNPARAPQGDMGQNHPIVEQWFQWLLDCCFLACYLCFFALK
ncbi:MAG: hypothetical protein CMI09_12595 [Oceanospirillaceae bacterium]|nr:hypothetical protein [Oceanospirillaceae bacterium]